MLLVSSSQVEAAFDASADSNPLLWMSRRATLVAEAPAVAPSVTKLNELEVATNASTYSDRWGRSINGPSFQRDAITSWNGWQSIVLTDYDQTTNDTHNTELDRHQLERRDHASRVRHARVSTRWSQPAPLDRGAGDEPAGVRLERGAVWSGVSHVGRCHDPAWQLWRNATAEGDVPAEYVHCFRGVSDGRWNRRVLPIRPGGRGKIVTMRHPGTQHDDVYAIPPGRGIASASFPERYKDWALVDTSEATRFVSQPVYDRQRGAAKGLLCIIGQQDATLYSEESLLGRDFGAATP